MDQASLAATRKSLHAVAELVLAGPQYRRSGDIRLQVSPGGFRTVTKPDLRVDGGDLVAPGRRLPINRHSCAELAAAAGVRESALHDVYQDGVRVAADEPLDVDPEAARWLARCWMAGDAALRLLAPDERPILWPEHFDVAVRLEDANYGVSPGDQFVEEPYAYIGPPAPQRGSFWDQPFGAARPMRELDNGSPEAVLEFLLEGRRRLTATR